jgi:cellobiose phosphorylase
VIGPYGSVAHPLAADRGGLSSSPCCGEKAAFAIEKETVLSPSEEKEIIFVLGIAFSREEIKKYMNIFASSEAFTAEKKKVLTKFTDEVSSVSINTPDKKLNCTFEWLKHQSNLGSRWARVRHNGYRDMTSDTDCLASVNPDLALERFLRILSYQYPNGYAPRTFKDGKIQDNNYVDCAVWLPSAAHTLITELGDPSLLREEIPFNDGSTATVFEHLRRAMQYLYDFHGENGLIKIWGGDWHDGLNWAGLKGKGVSIWLSIAWYRANKLFVELAEMLGGLFGGSEITTCAVI